MLKMLVTHVMLATIVKVQTLLKLHAQEDISVQQAQSMPHNTHAQLVFILPQVLRLLLIAQLVDQVNTVLRVVSSNTIVLHGQHAQEAQETIKWSFAPMASTLTRVIQQPVYLATPTITVPQEHHIH
jgi:hypothetical protein